MRPRIEPIPPHAKEVARGYCAVTQDGQIYRVIRNRGTWQGRKLNPYSKNNRGRYVTFHYEERRAVVDVELLAHVTFRGAT